MDMRRMGLAGVAASMMATGAIAHTPQEPVDAPIRIGMLDTSIRNLPVRDRNVKIVSKDFLQGTPATWEGESYYSHGELVAASAVRSARAVAPSAPISIFVSNIYTKSEEDVARFAGGRAGRGLADPGKIHLRLNYDAAEKAVDWMKSEGVNVVIVTATGPDTPGMLKLARHIQQNGMTIVASTNNDVVKDRVYPAAYPDVIAVAGADRSLPISQSPDLASYVSYVADARAPIKDGSTQEIGSSFAAGSIGGLAAAYGSIRPEASMRDIRQWLDGNSVNASYAGHQIPTVSLDAFKGGFGIVPERQAAVASPVAGATPPGPDQKPKAVAVASRGAFLASMSQSR